MIQLEPINHFKWNNEIKKWITYVGNHPNVWSEVFSCKQSKQVNNRCNDPNVSSKEWKMKIVNNYLTNEE